MFGPFNGKTDWDPEFPCKYGGGIFFGSEFGIMEAKLMWVQKLKCTNLRCSWSNRGLICRLGVGRKTGWRLCFPLSMCNAAPHCWEDIRYSGLCGGKKAQGPPLNHSPGTTSPWICLERWVRRCSLHLFHWGQQCQAFGKVGHVSCDKINQVPLVLLWAPAILDFISPWATADCEIWWLLKVSQPLCTGNISAALTPALEKEGVEIALLYQNSWPAETELHFSPLLPLPQQVWGSGDATAGALHVIFTLLLMTLQGLAWPSPYASRLCLLAAAATGAKWDSFH